MLVRSRVRLLVAAVGGLVCAASVMAWSATPASGAPGPPESFIRTVEPWDAENPPVTPPAVDLTAACVRPVRGGQLEAVFGYDNHGPNSILVSLDPDTTRDDDANVILRTVRVGPIRALNVEDLGPQVTLFKPGDHPHAFAVRFDRKDRVAWQVRVPSEAGDDGGWKVTVSPHMKVSCRPNVREHFAVVQDVDIRFELLNIAVEAPPFQIVSYAVGFDVPNVRAACSGGGALRAPRVFVGWPAGINLEPIVPNYDVDITLTGGTFTFQMTKPTARPVENIRQEVAWLGPIADVTARCAFGDRLVRSDVFWAELAGGGRVVPEIVDGAVVDLSVTQVSPGGIRLR